jgi:Flp pilus assembly protein TadD
MRRFVLFLLLLISSHAWAQRWVRVPGPDFTVYTNAGDSRGREIVLKLEQMRHVFPLLLPRDKMAAAPPLVVAAFKDRRDFENVAPLFDKKPIDVGAIFLKGEDRSYIALDAGSNDWSPAYHEYAHFLLDLNMPRTPLWFDEGFADYFSTLRFEKDSYMLGGTPQQYATILQEPWMPLEQVLSITPYSPEHKGMQHGRGAFSAESWLLVHYLLSFKMLPQAMQYFSLVFNQNESPSMAVQNAFGMTFKELQDRLKAYLPNAGMQRLGMPFAMEKLSYQVEPLKDYEAQALIADLHLLSPDHQNQAEAEFRQVLQAKEGAVLGHAGMGYLFMRRGQLGAAHDEFVRSTELGSTDPSVWYLAAYTDYKQKGLKDRAPVELVELNKLLDQAIKLDPSNGDALNLKALVLASASNPAEAIRLLRRACEVRPRNEEYKLNLAYQLLAARRFDEADAVLHRLQRSANPEIVASANLQLQNSQRWRTSKLLQQSETESADKYTDPRWRPAKGSNVETELEQLEKRQAGQANEAEVADKRPIKFALGTLLIAQCNETDVEMKARIGTRVLTLRAADKSKVVTIGADRFDCSWKNKQVALQYKERSRTEADLVSIEVR